MNYLMLFKHYLISLLSIIGTLIVVLSTTTPILAEDGITDDTIVLGQSAALSGPTANLGQEMEKGLRSYFNKINSQGGIDGRTIKLITLDDAYEPNRTINNTKRLINDDKVFLLIGSVGTPTSRVALPIAKEKHVPFIAPYTGAAFLRDPSNNEHIVNIRSSYEEEMEHLVEYLHERLGYTQIAIFYQNDSYGKAGLSSLKSALDKRQLNLIAEGTYERNTTVIRAGLLAIRKANPEAIVMVGTYKACAAFIKFGKQVLPKETTYSSLSFVGTTALLNELGDSGDGVIISQVMPSPYDTTIPLVQEYQETLLSSYPDAIPNWISLEGYLAGKFFVEAAKRAGENLTRETWLQAINDQGTFEMGGITLNLGPNDNQGMNKVYLTKIKGNTIVDIQ